MSASLGASATQTVVVANIAEFNLDNVRGHYTPGEWAMWIRAGNELADMAAFGGGSAALLIVPEGLDRGWLSDLNADLGWSLEAVSPESRSGRLLDDALADDAFMSTLARRLSRSSCRVEAWGATEGLLRFVDALRALGVLTQCLAPTRDRLWTVSYLDGKLALNDVASRLPELRIPASWVAVDYPQLMGMAGALSEAGRSFVVKSNAGVGGFGMFAALDPDRRESARTIEQLTVAIDEEPIFREGPFVVQEWLLSADDRLRPTYDGIVGADGEVETVGVGGMLIDGCFYRGVVVGEVPLAKKTLDQCRELGERVGQIAGELGYRGWFDVTLCWAMTRRSMRLRSTLGVPARLMRSASCRPGSGRTEGSGAPSPTTTCSFIPALAPTGVRSRPRWILGRMSGGGPQSCVR
jgi:hypothetical protein